jgi:glycosyltransferase (activator-dependent family)
VRVLFVANPEKTIFLSMVPLAWALRTAGHDVRFAGQPGFADVITRAGLTAVPVGRDRDPYRIARLTPGRVEVERAGLHPPWDVCLDPANAVWDRMLAGHVDAVDLGHKPENFPIIAGLVEFARQWQPDLVVWEPLTYAGGIAARACGAASARLLFGIDVFGVTRDHYRRLMAERPEGERADPLGEWLGSYGRKYGFSFGEDMTTGHFTIDPFPAGLQLTADLHYVPMRYVPYNGTAVVPRWLWEPQERPRVALTMGLTATDSFDGYTIDVQDILDALSTLDVEVVATIAAAEQKKLARVPANARLVPFVPLHALAPTCSVAIHHAGPGTLAAIAAHGVPQLTLPYSFDEPIFAQKLAAQGAGIDLGAGPVTGDTVRNAVVRLLRQPYHRDRALALRDEMREMPSPNEVVEQIEELTAKYRDR